ncbi:MAG: hypothetical protein U0X20_07195 [Caldilineaceae bacterium]
MIQSNPGDDPRVLIHQVKELRSLADALGELRNLHLRPAPTPAR